MIGFTGNPPIEARRQEKEVLRCNRCGVEYQSHEKSLEKWDNSARSSVVIQKTSGMPFYRLSKLQSLYNIPVAPSTLWDQCLGLWNDCGFDIYKHLISIAGNCDVFYLDDTGAKIIEVMQEHKTQSEKERRHCHTTGIVTTTREGNKMALFLYPL